MNEAKNLIEKAQRYLKSAELLMKDGDYDSSASRTYYAMFYCAEAALLKQGLTFSSHKGVISAFGEHFVKTGTFPREMGRALNSAFAKRQIGDYEYTSVTSNEDAEDLLYEGKIFAQTIADWLENI